MKPKRRRYSPKTRRPGAPPQQYTMVFTAEGLSVIQASFHIMDEVFDRQLHAPNPRLPFALETFNSVKQKVFDMLHAPGERFEFDGNEIIIVRAALQMYHIDLICMKASPERDYLIAMCQAVGELLPKDTPSPSRLHD